MMTEDERGDPTDVVLRFRSGETTRRSGRLQIDSDSQLVIVGTDAEGIDEIPFSSLKAVFFPRRALDAHAASYPEGGIELAVEFDDGEVIRGRTSGYNPASAGFFLYPADQSKSERVFVIAAAVVSIDVERL